MRWNRHAAYMCLILDAILCRRVKSSPESSSDQEEDEEDEGVGLEAEPSSSQQRRRERPKKNEKPKKRPPVSLIPISHNSCLVLIAD